MHGHQHLARGDARWIHPAMHVTDMMVVPSLPILRRPPKAIADTHLA
jgi:hypothetical protein